MLQTSIFESQDVLHQKRHEFMYHTTEAQNVLLYKCHRRRAINIDECDLMTAIIRYFIGAIHGYELLPFEQNEY